MEQTSLLFPVDYFFFGLIYWGIWPICRFFVMPGSDLTREYHQKVICDFWTIGQALKYIKVTYCSSGIFIHVAHALSHDVILYITIFIILLFILMSMFLRFLILSHSREWKYSLNPVASPSPAPQLITKVPYLYAEIGMVGMKYALHACSAAASPLCIRDIVALTDWCMLHPLFLWMNFWDCFLLKWLVVQCLVQCQVARSLQVCL